MVSKYTFANGVEVPMLGIGFDQVRDIALAQRLMEYALETGYRSVDTAHSYGNETGIGNAVRESGIKREEIYITTKLTAKDQGYDSALRAFDRSMNNLQLDYLDCFLIHWPGKYLFTDTWRAFVRLYEEKAVRVIGVCNFNIHHLKTVERETGVLPMVNQFESHPYYPQNELADYCLGRGILTEAWSPMMCGGAIFADPTIGAVAVESGRTPAQVILRWHIQKGHRIFPKSVHTDRIDSNFRIFDFALDDGQMERINALEGKNEKIGPNPDVFFEVFQ